MYEIEQLAQMNRDELCEYIDVLGYAGSHAVTDGELFQIALDLTEEARAGTVLEPSPLPLPKHAAKAKQRTEEKEPTMAKTKKAAKPAAAAKPAKAKKDAKTSAKDDSSPIGRKAVWSGKKLIAAKDIVAKEGSVVAAIADGFGNVKSKARVAEEVIEDIAMTFEPPRASAEFESNPGKYIRGYVSTMFRTGSLIEA